MQRLFSHLLFLISCLCIYHHLLSFVKAGDAVTTSLCDAETQSQKCANLGDISYPFGDVAPCAESAGFRISNCSSSQAYWDGFTQALGSDEDKLGAPALIGIFRAGYISFINLTWDMSLSLEAHAACDPLSADNVSTYIPQVINLTSFADGNFQISAYNFILLLGCSDLSPSSPASVQINSPICQAYRNECSFTLMDCVEIAVPTNELMLHQALESFSCTHFQFLVTANNDTTTPISSWQPGIVQLVYTDPKCTACILTNGTCVYDKVTTHTFQECACANSTYSDTDCSHIRSQTSCKGLECNTGAKIGVALTVVLTAAALCFAAFHCYIKKRKDMFTKPVPLKMGKSSMRQKLFGIHYSMSQLNLDELTERPIEYTYASIASATNSFIDFLGEGGFGAVYKGTLADASGNLPIQIAVKVLEVRSKHSNKQFLSEVATIGRINHFHVVRLLGFCIQENREMLVYEYVINGSLDKWLFNHQSDQNQMLHWGQRYTIALGIAKGLSYLHEECRHRIVHRDIKPQNILLDGQMCPKIADFGLARLMSREESKVATLAQGTPGYMAPEFWMGGESQLSTKFDVYSYGMVLLELMSGHRNFEDGLSFPEMAFEAAMRGDFKSIMDVKLGIPMQPPDGESNNSEGIEWQQVRTALFVALWCIQDHPMCRPSMSEVVKYLEGMAAINEQPPQPAMASTMSSLAQQQTYLSSHHHDDITPLSGAR